MLSTVLQVGSTPIPISSFSFGDTAPNSNPLAGTTSSKPSFDDVTVKLDMSKASPGLLYAVASGQHYPEVTLLTRDPASGVVYSTIKLSDVTFSSYDTADAQFDGAPVPREQVSLKYGKIEWSYAVLNSDNRTVQGGWDVARSRSLGGGIVTGDPGPVNPTGEYVLDTGAGIINPTSFRWGETNAAKANSGGSSKPILSDVSFDADLNAAAVDLAISVATGRHYNQFVFSIRNAAGNIYSRWTLTDVSITSEKVFMPDNNQGTQHFTVKFAKIKQEFIPQNPDGPPSEPAIIADWDIKRQSGHGGTPLGESLFTPKESMTVENGLAIMVKQIAFGDKATNSNPLAGTTSSKPSFDDVKVTLDMSQASPGLLYAVASGKRFKNVTLLSRDLASGLVYSTIKLSDVIFSSYDTADTPGDFLQPQEQVSLKYGKLDWSYAVIRPDGSAGDTVRGSWDIKGAKGSSGGIVTGDPGSVNPTGEYVLDTGAGIINPTSFRWGETNAAKINSGGSSKASFGDLSFDANLNAAAVDLAVSVATGRHYKQFVFSIRDSHGDVYSRWTLTDVTIGSESVVLPEDGQGTQHFTLKFAKIKQEFIPHNPDGSADPPISAEWDLKRNQGSGSTPLGQSVYTPPESMTVENGLPIVIREIAWGDKAPNSNPLAGTTSSKLSFDDVKVTLDMSQASPGLLYAVASGEHFREVTLQNRNILGTLYSTIKLSDVIFSAYDTADASGEDFTVPEEQVSLRFAKIEWTYAVLNSDGNVSQTVQGGWDVQRQRSLGGGVVTGDPGPVNPTGVFVLNTGAGIINPTSFSWGETKIGSANSGGSSKPILGDFSFDADLNAAAVDLAFSVATGRHYNQFVLSIRGPDGTVFSRWTLTDVFISSESVILSNLIFQGKQHFTLKFAKIKQEFIPQNPDGSADPPIIAEWNLKRNQGVGPSLDSGGVITLTAAPASVSSGSSKLVAPSTLKAVFTPPPKSVARPPIPVQVTNQDLAVSVLTDLI